MEPTCRACLQVEVIMVDILSEEVEDLQSNLCTLLEQCGSIKVDKNDSYPKYLCKECTGELLIAAKFRAKCLHTQSILEQIERELQEAKANEEALERERKEHEEQRQEFDEEEFVEQLPEGELDCNGNIDGSVQEIIQLVFDEEKEAVVPVNNDAELCTSSADNDVVTISYEVPVEHLVREVFEEDELIEQTAPDDFEEAKDDSFINDIIVFDNEDDAADCMLPSEVLLDDLPMTAAAQGDFAMLEDPVVMSSPEESSELAELSSATQFVCDECGASFLQVGNLKRHLENAHAKDKLFSCSKCTHYFSQEVSYAAHSIKCSYSRTAPKKKPELDVAPDDERVVHKKRKKRTTPNTPRPINKCSYCGKETQSYFALQMHLRTHTGERPFQCSHCEKRFKTHSSLKTHLRRHRRPELSCTICDKTFFETSNLRVHMRTHTGEKPHACAVCFKRFSRVFLLQLHMRTHSGEKPYQCDHCTKAFAQLCDLKNHMRTHTGEREHQCQICGKAFIRRYALLVHMERHGKADTKILQLGTDPALNEAIIENDDDAEQPDTEQMQFMETVSGLDDSFNLSDIIDEEVR